MKRNDFNEAIVKKITELIPTAPHDWAKQIAKIMGKTDVTIYAYARGVRGVRRGYPLQVLKHLSELIEKKKQEIEELIA